MPEPRDSRFLDRGALLGLLADLPEDSLFVDLRSDVPCIYVETTTGESLSIVATRDGFDVWAGDFGNGGPIQLNASRQEALDLAWRAHDLQRGP